MSESSEATTTFLERFQFSPGRADLKHLGDLSFGFAGLPWENLTKFIKKNRPLDTEKPRVLPARLAGVPGAEKLRLSDEVMRDHAEFGSGGTCFSLTNALRRIATDLGYRARPVMADMRQGTNVHCALLVELDGRRFLLDPGYLVAEPVSLDPGRSAVVRQAGATLEYRSIEGRDEYELHTANDRGERRLRYRLRADPVADRDFVRFWLESFDSSGMNGLHLNRITQEGRLSAHDLNLRVETGRGKSNVKLREGYVEQVSDRFDIDRELVERAFAEWERLRCPRR